MSEFKKYTMEELRAICDNQNPSKGDLFKPLRDANREFDYALPQDWLDDFSKFCEKYAPELDYHLILFTTVWSYPESAPFTLLVEVDKAIDLYAIAITNGWK